MLEVNKLIIDANVVFSALIKKSMSFELIRFLPKKGIKLYSPKFLWEEVDKRTDRLLKFSKLSPSELEFLIGFLSKKIKVVSISKYEESIPQAKKILKGHLKDVPYFALALKLSSPIWSNEKRFKNQSKVKIFSTYDLVKLLEL